MTAWHKTSHPELARRCAYCGALRGKLCITTGGRIAGGPYAYQSHRVRFHRLSGSLEPIGHGPCEQAPAGSTWEHFGGHQ